jgi:tRNA threonylcarbamoyladenosine biosynthesis protein TsaE
MTNPSSLDSRSTADTEALGEALAPALAVGDVIALTGPLGAGKTRFVAGLARGLGCAARVRSPSFTLVNEYRGRLLLVHLDLYRLGDGDAETLGLEEYLARGALAVEWGEKLPAIDRRTALTLGFEIISQETRRLTPSAEAGRGVALLQGWLEQIESARRESS